MNNTINKLNAQLAHARKLYNQLKQQSTTWCWEDVMEQADQKGLKLPKWKAQWLIEEIIRKHDASIGINWDVIDAYLDNYEQGSYNDDFKTIIENRQQKMYAPVSFPVTLR